MVAVTLLAAASVRRCHHSLNSSELPLLVDGNPSIDCRNGNGTTGPHVRAKCLNGYLIRPSGRQDCNWVPFVQNFGWSCTSSSPALVGFKRIQKHCTV
jgi:hypothetical protein